MKQLFPQMACLLIATVTICTITYAQSTLPVWSTTYGVGAPLIQYGLSDFVVDSAGNSFPLCTVNDTTWNSGIWSQLHKYNSTGQLLWEDSIANTQNLCRLKVATSGICYVATAVWTGSEYAFLIRKLAPSGTRIWTKYYGSAQGYTGGRINAMALDDSENIYLAGESWPGEAAVMLKCDSAGTVTWNTTFSHLPNKYDRAYGIDFDSQGNSYVCVMSQDSNNYPDVFTLKYSTSGQLVWQRQFGGSYYEWPKFIKVFNDTSVYVGGDYGGPTYSDYLFLQYDSSGQFKWSQVFDPQAYYNYPGNASDQSRAMIVTHNGNVILTGSCFQGTGAPRQINTAFDPQGNLLWVRRDFKAAEGFSISEDRSGHLVFGGFALDTVNNIYGAGLSKYDSLGSLLWSTIYTSSLTEDYYNNHAGFDYTGNIYCSSENFNYPAREITTLKFDYTLSVEGSEMQSDCVTVYPNPFSSTLHFNVIGEKKIEAVQLYDALGNLIIEKASNVSNSFTIETGELPAGIYFYRVETNDGQLQSGKVIAR